jgi:hypothetical protein
LLYKEVKAMSDQIKKIVVTLMCAIAMLLVGCDTEDDNSSPTLKFDNSRDTLQAHLNRTYDLGKGTTFRLGQRLLAIKDSVTIIGTITGQSCRPNYNPSDPQRNVLPDINSYPYSSIITSSGTYDGDIEFFIQLDTPSKSLIKDITGLSETQIWCEAVPFGRDTDNPNSTPVFSGWRDTISNIKVEDSTFWTSRSAAQDAWNELNPNDTLEVKGALVLDEAGPLFEIHPIYSIIHK